MFKKYLLSAGILALLSACASTTSTGTKSALSPSSKDARIYADYLIGAYTDNISDAENRSEYFGRAYSEDSSDIGLARKAVTAAWLAGETSSAQSKAKNILRLHPDEPFSRTVLGAQAFAGRNYTRAQKYMSGSSEDPSLQILMDIMSAWSENELGDQTAGSEKLEQLSGWAYVRVIGKLQQINMTSGDGDLDKALGVYDVADSAGVATTETALSRARLLSKTGDIDAALLGLTEFDDANGGFESGPVKLYLDELKADKPISALTPQQEASWAMTEAAYGFFVRNRAFDMAEVYLRTAISIDPNNDKAKIWLAALIEDSRQDESLELFRSVKSDSPYVVSARLSESNIFFDRDEDAAAIKILEAANQKYATFTTREALGRARLIRENYKDALPIYDEIVKSMSEDDIKNNTQPLYFRAICHEREEMWDEAVADFQRVLEIEPEDADALNYLGYTWVDRNENLTEAFEMIEKAVELEPKSGAIIDSLGWAHYKLGRYSKARENLEKAVELSPNSATIIDHLGDAYWKVGRFREAGYQWQRALEYDPTDKERKKINAKLKGGLSAAPSD